MTISELTADILSRLYGSREQILRTLLAHMLSDEHIILVEQRMSDGKTIKFQYRWEHGDLQVPSRLENILLSWTNWELEHRTELLEMTTKGAIQRFIREWREETEVEPDGE